MHPYVYLFSLELPVYGLISLLGVLAAGVVLFVLSKKKGMDFYDLLFTALVGGVGVFVGAHILYALTRAGDIISAISYFDDYVNKWDFVKYVFSLAGGMVFYGGLYGGLVAGFIFVRKKNYPADKFSDAFAVVIPLFHAFGRVGCFFAGCCYGVKWKHGIEGRVISSEVTEQIRRFPVQLLEALCLLILFSLLLFLLLKGKFAGKLMAVYLSSYAVLRFCLEFLRGDEIRGHFLMLSTSQWISLATLLGVLLYFMISRRKNKTE